MKSFGNDTVTFLVRTEGAQDELGIPSVSVTPVVTPGCSVQRATDMEAVSSEDLTISRWRAFCPPTTTVLALKATDGAQYKGVEYEVYGDPELWTDRRGNAHHVTVILRKARG